MFLQIISLQALETLIWFLWLYRFDEIVLNGFRQYSTKAQYFKVLSGALTKRSQWLDPLSNTLSHWGDPFFHRESLNGPHISSGHWCPCSMHCFLNSSWRSEGFFCATFCPLNRNSFALSLKSTTNRCNYENNLIYVFCFSSSLFHFLFNN